MPSLFVIQGRDQGQRFDLAEPNLTLGRVVGNDIQIHDTEVSREHAELIQRGDQYFIRDQGSSNGTFVNEQQVQERELASGDRIQIGRTLLLYTGVREEMGDLREKVNIVSSHDEEGSRIVHAMGQSEGSEIFSAPEAATDSPWLARAQSNLQIMYRTALAVSHTLDIDQLLSRIMEMIFDWVDADRGCIMLKGEDGVQLEPRVRRHRRGLRTDDRITISKTILDYVVEHNEGVLTSNARDDGRWNPAQSIVRMGVREAICVPMQGRYGMVGIIYIDTSITPQRMLQLRSSDKFTQEHLKLMIAIAHQAALAVEDTSYYQAMVQAERLAAVGQTIATLSHHIKNILQGVRGGSYLIELGIDEHGKALASGADPAAAQKAVETMRKGWKIVEKNQDRISTLVLDMLTFSKDREPEPEPAELNEVVSDVIELMQSRATEHGVELVWQPTELMPTLMFDPEAIHRAVLNVVTNAIDACDERDPARVEVRTSFDSASNSVAITVQDTGVGIEKDDLQKIFTVFVSKKGGRGTGLGLPVSQKILQEHGGRIRVTSESGQGSTFTLELPAHAPGSVGGDPGDSVRADAGPTLAGQV